MAFDINTVSPTDGWNYYEFTITSANTKIQLNKDRGGDTTDWDGKTYWDYGNVATAEEGTTTGGFIEHIFDSPRTYVVKTKWKLAKYHISSDNNPSDNQDTCNLLTNVYGINHNMTNVYRLFNNCTALTDLSQLNWDTSNVTNMVGMFYYCSALTTLNVSNWDTSKVTDMSYMFVNCNKLTTLNVSNWDTSNVTTINSIFYGCSSLTTLDVSKWDVSSVTNMGGMFAYCTALPSLDVSKWNVSSVTNMSGLFNNCKSLTFLDVSKWDTSNVTNMSNMFSTCESLTSLDVSKWDTSNVTNMSNMFSKCSSLTNLDVSKWDTSNVTNMSTMFGTCRALTNLDVSSFNTKNVTNMSYMFRSNNLTNLDVSNFYVSNVANFSYMFGADSELTTINLSNWIINNSINPKFSSVFIKNTLMQRVICHNTTIESANKIIGQLPDRSSTTPGIFELSLAGISEAANKVDIDTLTAKNWNIEWGCHGDFNYFEITITAANTTVSLINNRRGDKSKWDGINEWGDGKADTSLDHTYTQAGKYVLKSKLTLRDPDTHSNPIDNLVTDCFMLNRNMTNLTSIFDNMKNLNKVSGSINFDTSNVVNMNKMFSICESLTSLDVSNWDVSNVNNMKNIFTGTGISEFIGINNWDTSNVTNMSAVFGACKSLTSLDVSNWDTSNVTNMNSAFSLCENLTSLNIDNWDTRNVNDMTWMFRGCSSLTDLKMKNLNTNSATNITQMFGSCKINSLDLSKWKTNCVTNMRGLFNGCTEITELDLSNFDLSSTTNIGNIFNGLTNLTKLNLTGWKLGTVTSKSNVFTGSFTQTDATLILRDMSATDINTLIKLLPDRTGKNTGIIKVDYEEGINTSWNDGTNDVTLEGLNWKLEYYNGEGYWTDISPADTQDDEVLKIVKVGQLSDINIAMKKYIKDTYVNKEHTHVEICSRLDDIECTLKRVERELNDIEAGITKTYPTD